MNLIEHNLLTLDFWQDHVTYEGKSMPTGTLACAALNLPDEVIAKLARLCVPLNLYTMFEVSHIYQLTPEPPVMECVNDYIVAAIEQDDLRYFSYFLHHTEPRLNGRVKSFLLREGLDRYDPERFLDYKQNCVLAMLECLKTYDPDKGAEFLTYAHHFIGNALLDCRMKEESGSFSSLDEYKNVRGIAWLYNQSGNGKKAAAQYAEREGCSEETAEQYLAVARLNRSQVPFYATV